MPGLLLETGDLATDAAKTQEAEYGFLVLHQKLELEFDFSTQSVTGRTEITILPQRRDLKTIRIDARQCTIPANGITVNGILTDYSYEDPTNLLKVPDAYHWTAHQHKLQRDRIKPLTISGYDSDTVALEIEIPLSVNIEEANSFGENAAAALAERAIGASAARNPSLAINGTGEPVSATSLLTPKTAAEQSARFKSLTVSISFALNNYRDGLFWVGMGTSDARFPHVYTRHAIERGTASCIFPCVDDPAMRCNWDLSIKCSRTLGDALKKKPRKAAAHGKKQQALVVHSQSDSEESELSEEDKLLEMVVVCSGELLNEIIDPDDSSKKILSFEIRTIVAPQHIGFSIGPFEQVDLSEFREEADEEKLGQGQSVRMTAFCLPGRLEELRHTCTPIAPAMDHFTLDVSSFPFTEYKLVFVDEQVRDVAHTAGLSICDSRLLFPEDIIDPEEENIRTLVHALASQWIGVMIVPNTRVDRWVTIGLSHYMAGLFMQRLYGNNPYMFRQKVLSDKLVELDVLRPSLTVLGEIMELGSFEEDFLTLKAPLVLFILDRRIVKGTASLGISRAITKIAFTASTSSASESVLSTESFRKQVEKVCKYSFTAPFWNQWILGAGCPKFVIHHKFNKKRVVIEMKINQVQKQVLDDQRSLSRPEFLRELKEEVAGIYAGEVNTAFTGSMTIRIHEADGTPYEHVVDVSNGNGYFEIPYATKYKRLKRSRRQKERAAMGAGDLEAGEDAPIKSLGDVLLSQQDVRDWGLQDWNEDQQQRMENESYEWFRIDADFEWLCSKTFDNMEPWMYISQLQQDQNVVAQQESMLWLQSHRPHPLAATFMVRTLMDPRYFYGIRRMAAEALPVQAVPELGMLGSIQLEKAYSDLYCFPGSKTPRTNDFRKKDAYFVQKSIPRAVARVRSHGKCPKDARHFLLDQLRFNDNGSNEFSDYHKMADLLDCLTQSLLPIAEVKDDNDVLFAPAPDEDEDDPEPGQFRDTVIEELDRFRRSDEWINSYQNIYTTTVLDCKKKLMKARVIPEDFSEFAKYLLDGNSYNVRLKAFEALADLGLIAEEQIAPFVMNVLSTDPSPFVRTQLFKIFVAGLALIALGEHKNTDGHDAQVDGDGDMMIVESEVQAEARKAQLLRTSSIAGALSALKVEMQNNMVVKHAIWDAVKSHSITLPEQIDLLDLCNVLYDAEDSLVLTLNYPRFVKITNLGKGKIAFTKTNKARTRPLRPRQALEVPPPSLPPPVVQPVVQPALQPVVKREMSETPSLQKIKFNTSFSSSATSMGPPKTLKRPAPPERSQSSASLDGQPPAKKRNVIKFKVPIEKVQHIQRSPPQPTIQQRKKTPSARSSPAAGPKPSPSPSIQAPSPSIKFSTSPAPQSQPRGTNGIVVIKARKPLPDPTSLSTPAIKERKPLPDAGTPPPVVKRSQIIKLKIGQPKTAPPPPQ